jgi:hypothetical protein
MHSYANALYKAGGLIGVIGLGILFVPLTVVGGGGDVEADLLVRDEVPRLFALVGAFLFLFGVFLLSPIAAIARGYVPRRDWAQAGVTAATLPFWLVCMLLFAGALWYVVLLALRRQFGAFPHDEGLGFAFEQTFLGLAAYAIEALGNETRYAAGQPHSLIEILSVFLMRMTGTVNLVFILVPIREDDERAS